MLTLTGTTRLSPDADWIDHSLRLIDDRISFFGASLAKHPVRKFLEQNLVPPAIMIECAAMQFRSSILWVPMLSLMKDRVKNERLRKALLDNMLCESGAHAISHVELCSRFLKSVEQSLGREASKSPLPTASLEDVVFVTSLSEPEINGWLLAAEALTPVSDQLLLEGFQQVSGVDLTFLNEHVVVDSEEHSQWMRESAAELLKENDCLPEILAGVDIGARAEFKLIDWLHMKMICSM